MNAHTPTAVAPVPTASPETVGFSSERLAKLDAAMQAQIDDGRYAAISVMVARHGSVVKDVRFGYQDLESHEPLRPDAIFRQASQTKPLTGAGLWILYEDGRWQLDDPVAKYIPEFADLQVASENGLEPMDHPIKMRELMSSSGGWPVGLGGIAAPGSATDDLYTKANIRSGTVEDMLTALSKLPLETQPGTHYRYGLQHDIMGAMIQRLSGQPLDEFLQERLFTPLGMVDTGFGVPESERGRIAPTYAYDADLKLVRAQTQAFGGGPPGVKGKFLSGGGGIFSTMSDYIRFLVMLQNGGELNGRRILAPSTVELMGRNLLAEGVNLEFLETFRDVGQNGGFAIVLDSATASYNSGAFGKGTMFWGGAFGTWCWVDPLNDVVVLGMSQLETAAAAYVGMPTQAPDLRALSRSLTYQALVEPSR
jgi:CubicO group peptidase (beta-lactamase class C family)